MKEAITTTHAPTPIGPYSQAIRAGGFIFVAGQGPIDPATGEITAQTIADQTRRTLDNIQAILEAAGASMADVVKTTVHLADMADFKAFNDVYATYFPDPKPVRTTVGSALPNIKVEIDVIAEEGQG